MKTLISAILIGLFSISAVYGQEIIYPEIEKELSAEQKETFDKAVLILQKASGNENNANAIDYKYRKKRNSPKWELKTWEAKEQRIIAERNYQQAYSMLSGVYSNIISNSAYKNQSDKFKAQALDREATEKYNASKEILSKFQDVSKLSMANTNYDMLLSELKKCHELKIDGIQDQISALKINHEKADKNIDQQDLAAWERAISKNTTESYNEYLNNNPRGKYMSKANDMIRQIEKGTNDVADNNINKTRYNKSNKENKTGNPEKNPSTNKTRNSNDKLTKSSSNNSELIFKVQVAASKITLSDWILSHKAPGADLIEEYRSSEWIKYMVGSFKSYQEAAQYRDKLVNTAPDAFIVVFEKGKQTAVTEQMKM